MKEVLTSTYVKLTDRIAKARIGRIDPPLYGLLMELQSSRSAAVNFVDALALYTAVMKDRPSYLLEMGPGTSTVVICHALSQVLRLDSSYAPRFIALEDSPEWLAYHEDHFPQDLRPLVEMSYVPAKTSLEDYGVVAHFEEVPPLPFDFVHVDGPSNVVESGFRSDDVIRIRGQLGPSCHVIFDGRSITSRLTAEHLTDFRHSRNPWTLNHELRRR